jgi:hypothetical protein
MVSARSQAAGLIVATLGLAALNLVVSRSSGARPSTTVEITMEAWWADLEKGEHEANRAVLKLYDRPKDAVAFLKTKMKPLTISSGQVKALVLKLGSAHEAVWKPAFEELEYFDPRLAIDLKTLMDRYTETPTRQRLVEVLSAREAGSLNEREIRLSKVEDGFNFVGKTATRVGSWWAEPRIDRINAGSWSPPKKKWTRAIRAILLLEHIGTPDATTILKDMATGHPDAYPTKLAKEALKAVGSKP